LESMTTQLTNQNALCAATAWRKARKGNRQPTNANSVTCQCASCLAMRFITITGTSKQQQQSMFMAFLDFVLLFLQFFVVSSV
jgi:hypothetical protein